jgi:hypothetical protein
MAAPTCLLFASERYALPILLPLQRAIEARGGRALWWCIHGAESLPIPPAQRVNSAAEAVALRPDAVFSAANWVPHFVSGVKVQVFHGFNVEKRSDQRGHFRLRGLFDLYCTQGPATSTPFRALAEQAGHFVVEETGWPKLDPLFRPEHPVQRPSTAGGRPIVLFGSTFTPRLSAAPVLREEIARMVAGGRWYWLLTLHPKCPPALFDAYRALAGPNAEFIEPEELMRAQAQADVLLADTSSIVSEFVVQEKPVVTLRNRAPKPHMLDVQEPAEVEAAIERALAHHPALQKAIADYAAHIHPSRDGRAAERMLDAVERFRRGELRPRRAKPLNLFRKLQIRRDLGYWGLD